MRRLVILCLVAAAAFAALGSPLAASDVEAVGWSRQAAIDYFIANSGKQEHDIVVEVDRYIVWPGQALSYKIGELKIKELRAFAESELGEAFDVRAFHDVVLGNGALPLDVLEIQIHQWVDGLKAAMAKT